MVISEEENIFEAADAIAMKRSKALALLICNEFFVGFSFEVNLARLIADINQPPIFPFPMLFQSKILLLKKYCCWVQCSSSSFWVLHALKLVEICLSGFYTFFLVVALAH